MHVLPTTTRARLRAELAVVLARGACARGCCYLALAMGDALVIFDAPAFIHIGDRAQPLVQTVAHWNQPHTLEVDIIASGEGALLAVAAARQVSSFT